MKSLPARIRDHFYEVAVARPLTVGVEQEFFLLQRDGTPVTHQQSQVFFQRIAAYPERQFACDANLGSYIASVQLPGAVLKFDHHPFLFEIETMPSRELAVLQTCLMEAYDRIDKAAYELGLTFGRDPILAMSTHQPETHSSLIFRQELVDYRRRLFTRRHELIDLRLANYAAGIAATQVHVGGVGFAHYDRVVPLLYNAEPRVLSWAASRVQSRYPGAEVNQIRDNLYRSVFKGYPLVCYPDFEWSTTRWLDALMRTPLFGTPTDYFAAGTVEEYPELDALDVSDFLYRVRDLQWIKPHRQGTLEFRSVPALPSVADIVELCQIRLTMVHDLIHG